MWMKILLEVLHLLPFALMGGISALLYEQIKWLRMEMQVHKLWTEGMIRSFELSLNMHNEIMQP
jgi:hypothetical protein